MRLYKLTFIILILLFFIPLTKAENLFIEKYFVLNEYDPNDVYIPVNFYVGVFSSDKGNKISRTLLKFDINEVLDKKIDIAILNLEVKLEKEGTTADEQVLDVHEVLEDWDSATWNNQIDYNSKVTDSVRITGDGMYKVNITDLVQSWIINPRENFGILLKAKNENIINFKEFTTNSNLRIIILEELTECERNEGICKYSCDVDEEVLDYSCKGQGRCCREIGKPDLIVKDIKFIDAGDDYFDIYAVFENIGNVSSGYYDYEAYVNDEFLSAASNLKPLKPEEEIEVPLGTKELTKNDVVNVIVDPKNRIDEENERDNVGEEKVSAKEQFEVIEKEADIEFVGICNANGVCDGQENYQNCPQDCLSKKAINKLWITLPIIILILIIIVVFIRRKS